MNRNDYSYSPNHMMQAQHHHQGRMYMDKGHPGDFGQMMAHHQGPPSHHAPPHHAAHHAPSHHAPPHHAPSHHQGPPSHGHHAPAHMGHHSGEFDHEPLVLNNGHPQHGFYQQMNAPMLHVSTDFSNVNNMNGSMHNDHDDMDDNKSINGQKRSREELNQKEKKRMFKLNETIHQLKKSLDDAGVSCKKNKQSILDNTVHYISMLRNDLVIAKQKADHAERMLHSTGGGHKTDAPFDRYFENSSTPTLLMTLDLQVVRANRTFREATGFSEEALKNKEVLLGCLSADLGRARSLVHNAVDSRKTVRTVVQNAVANGRATSSLSLTLLLDPQGNPECLECVLIPMEDDQPQYDMLKEDVNLDEVSGLV